MRLTILVSFVAALLLLTSCRNSVTLSVSEAEINTELGGNAVNINTASAAELEKLPKIGRELAQRIIEYREKHGKFRRTEHLILVRGMSDKKFREIRNLIKTE